MVEQLEINIEPSFILNENESDVDEICSDPLELNFTDIPDDKQRCKYCYEIFDKESLATHLRTHYGKKRNKCLWKNQHGVECGKIFKRLEHLSRHVQTHDGSKLHRCTKCLKYFSRKDNIQKHMVIHSDVKSFTCKVCDKKFKRSDHLNKHLRIHPTPQANNIFEDSSKGERKGKVLKAQSVLGLE